MLILGLIALVAGTSSVFCTTNVAVIMKKIQERLAELIARHGFHGAYGNG